MGMLFTWTVIATIASCQARMQVLAANRSLLPMPSTIYAACKPATWIIPASLQKETALD